MNFREAFDLPDTSATFGGGASTDTPILDLSNQALEPVTVAVIPPVSPTSVVQHAAAQAQTPPSAIPPQPCGPTAAEPPFPDGVTADELRDAEYRAGLVRRYLELTASGMTGQRAASVLGVVQARFSGRGSWVARYRAGGVPALVTRREDRNSREARNAAELGVTPEHIAAAVRRLRLLYLSSNLTGTRGSMPDAATRFASEPACPAALRELIRSRMSRCLSPLPNWITRQVIAAEAVVRSARAPRDAQLAYVNAPGSLQLIFDPVTGEERRVRAGEFWTIDDGTLNFVAHVPLEVRESKCWQKFECIVGRFQLLLIADHASYFLPGFSYTARPKSSYRAEDLLATMHNTMLEHGAPGIGMVLEKGISAANSIERALNGVGCTIWRAGSPHSKVVEFVFNWLWTRLSHIPGSVGRYGGDEQEINRVVEACRQGYTDPRELFWPMPKVVQAIREAIVAWNQHLVNSAQYGRWVPAELWKHQAARNTRPLDPASAFLFAPRVTDPLVLKTACVNTSFLIMDGLSVQFSFSVPRYLEFFGARVRLHFNPFAEQVQATVTLAEPHNGYRAGYVLGTAEQINRYCAHTRRHLSYGDDIDLGRQAFTKMGQQLRRAVVAIRADGTVGRHVADARDNDGRGATIAVNPAPADTTAPAVPPVLSLPSVPPIAPPRPARSFRLDALVED